MATRKYKEQVAKQQKEVMAKIREQEHKLENQLIVALEEQGLTSARTEYGTPYKSMDESFPVVDWDAFLNFVKENNMWHMLERRASKQGCKQFREANDGALMPGVGYRGTVRVRVRSK